VGGCKGCLGLTRRLRFITIIHVVKQQWALLLLMLRQGDRQRRGGGGLLQGRDEPLQHVEDALLQLPVVEQRRRWRSLLSGGWWVLPQVVKQDPLDLVAFAPAGTCISIMPIGGRLGSSTGSRCRGLGWLL